jgi:hypothetical protein
MVIPVMVVRTVTLATTWTPWLVVESAVTTVVACFGILVGAVKVVVPPLAVCAGEKEPQSGALPHVATQSTPAPAGSLLTVAETGTAPPVTIERGGACVMLTDMIGVAAAGSAFEPVSAQPVMPSKQPRPATRGR